MDPRLRGGDVERTLSLRTLHSSMDSRFRGNDDAKQETGMTK
jgi:hypothetical protein